MVLISALLGNIQGSQAKNRFLVPLEVIWLKILFSKNFLEFSQLAKNMFFSWLHKNVEKWKMKNGVWIGQNLTCMVKWGRGVFTLKYKLIDFNYIMCKLKSIYFLFL